MMAQAATVPAVLGNGLRQCDPSSSIRSYTLQRQQQRANQPIPTTATAAARWATVLAAPGDQLTVRTVLIERASGGTFGFTLVPATSTDDRSHCASDYRGGAEVKSVDVGGPADKGIRGLMAGDLVLEVNGIEMKLEDGLDCVADQVRASGPSLILRLLQRTPVSPQNLIVSRIAQSPVRRQIRHEDAAMATASTMDLDETSSSSSPLSDIATTSSRCTITPNRGTSSNLDAVATATQTRRSGTATNNGPDLVPNPNSGRDRDSLMVETAVLASAACAAQRQRQMSRRGTDRGRCQVSTRRGTITTSALPSVPSSLSSSAQANTVVVSDTTTEAACVRESGIYGFGEHLQRRRQTSESISGDVSAEAAPVTTTAAADQVGNETVLETALPARLGGIVSDTGLLSSAVDFEQEEGTENISAQADLAVPRDTTSWSPPGWMLTRPQNDHCSSESTNENSASQAYTEMPSEALPPPSISQTAQDFASSSTARIEHTRSHGNAAMRATDVTASVALGGSSRSPTTTTTRAQSANVPSSRLRAAETPPPYTRRPLPGERTVAVSPSLTRRAVLARRYLAGTRGLVAMGWPQQTAAQAMVMARGQRELALQLLQAHSLHNAPPCYTVRPEAR